MIPKIKFGVIGCSRISQRSVIPAIINSKNSEIEMIGSRSLEKAEQFSNEFNCEKFGNYDDVISNNDVDVVYISTPIGTHEEWIKKAASAGKHILCEKSSTDSFDSAKKIIKSCKNNNVRILEALAFRFHPQHEKIKNLISNELKEIQNFYGIFGFSPPPNDDIRWNKTLGGGVLNDVSCYPICASRMVFQTEPISVSSNLQYDEKLTNARDVLLSSLFIGLPFSILIGLMIGWIWSKLFGKSLF